MHSHRRLILDHFVDRFIDIRTSSIEPRKAIEMTPVPEGKIMIHEIYQAVAGIQAFTPGNVVLAGGYAVRALTYPRAFPISCRPPSLDLDLIVQTEAAFTTLMDRLALHAVIAWGGLVGVYCLPSVMNVRIDVNPEDVLPNPLP